MKISIASHKLKTRYKKHENEDSLTQTIYNNILKNQCCQSLELRFRLIAIFLVFIFAD